MRQNLLPDLFQERHLYDPRHIRYSTRLAVSGNFELAHAILDLLKMPSAATRALLNQAKDQLGKNPIHTIATVDDPTRNDVLAWMREFRPVVVTGLLEHWNIPAWSPETLKAKFGNSRIAPFLPGALQDFIAAMASPNSQCRPPVIYTGGVALPEGLREHFPPPPILEGIVDFPQFWLGSSSLQDKPVTGLHCDCRHGFLGQIFGRKKITLYSPDQENCLYPYRAFNTFRPCWTGPDKPDYERFPLFKKAQPIEVILKPGETLFIPLGWFHCVFALDPVMSISLAANTQ
jgi:hypothetical protein